MKRKIIALLLCIVCVFSLCFPVAADDDGYSAIIGDIDKTCPTCGSALHAFWWSTSGAEVEVEISDTGKIKIPAGAGAIAHIDLKCKSCGYEKNETRLLGLDFGAEKPGKLVQAPSGIGRKDLPGYADDKGSALVDKDGWPTATYTMLLDGYDTSAGVDTVYKHSTSNNGSWFYQTTGSFSGSNGNVSVYGIYDSSSSNNNSVTASLSYYLIAPVSGYYTLNTTSFDASVSMRDINGSYVYGDKYNSRFNAYSRFGKGVSSSYKIIGYIYPKSGLTSWHFSPDSGSKLYFSKGSIIHFLFCITSSYSVNDSNPYESISIKSTAPTLTVQDLSPSQITNNNNITINNNTWNGNIYVDNSNNLTYIYPQYTTINEKNETVTNISNTPIIYNNETKKYYTYDTVTNNYYYITYEQPSIPTPSPSPSPAPTETPSPSESPTPTPTPDPGTAPTSTPKPGGSISTPETGKPGGSSGSSWWDKLLSKIGDAIIDGLLGAISAVLKLIFKLFSTILGWIIWLTSQVLTLFPFLPPGLGALLIGGVVVCFVIGIIKFIRG